MDEMLEAARENYRRAGPHETAQLGASGGLLVYTRPEAQRAKCGEIPGAIVIERNVLEWSLGPTSPDHHEALTQPDQESVVSLAVATCPSGSTSGSLHNPAGLGS
ncbi:MAG TPA: hypothetical protein VL984_12445 [Acidimicrobiales bacterium]|nr:hypothetical protein [Acidimicrobiales bacterium]